MPAIKLVGFSGEQPRIIPRLLPPVGAQSAINARLEDGSLTPYRAPTFVADLGGDSYENFTTIYLHGEDWLGFEGHVHAAPGPVAEDRLYYTGDGVPKLRVGSTIYNLAVPRPELAPIATLDGAGSGDVQTRVYVYTFVTGFGEESEPSPVSNEVFWQPGYDVILTNIEGDPDPSLTIDRNVTKQRFYRSQTGTVGTDFYFLAERDVSDAPFTDDFPVDEFAEALPSRHWNPPPDDLEGLIALPNGLMAAFVGKKLYFSEPFRPHAWPEIYVLTTDVPIVALGAMGTTIWVLTEGFPYRVVGTTPTAMVMDKVEASLPCINAKGVVDLGHAIAWPSTEGLAAAKGNGDVGLVSANLFSPQEWRRLNPGTMRGGQLNGRWIGAYDAVDQLGDAISGSLIIDLSGESFLIRSAVRARSWFHDIKSGFLYFQHHAMDEVWLFDSPTGDTDTLYWRSKQFVLPKPDNFGCILIESGFAISQAQIDARQELIDEIIAENQDLIDDGLLGGEIAGAPVGATSVAGDFLLPVPGTTGSGINVNVYADRVLVASVGEFDQVKRLPSGFLAREWEIDVFSDIALDQITMARTVDELKVASGGP
jgi:hypothetical protein